MAPSEPFRSRRFLLVLPLLLALCAAPGAVAATTGPAELVAFVDPSLTPWSSVCHLSACPPPEFAYGALPSRLTPFGDPQRLFFVADDGVHGAEPWVSDGSEAGTGMLLDLCAGDCSSRPQPIGVLAGEVVFWAETADDVELWITDGSGAGTRRLPDPCPGPCRAADHVVDYDWWDNELDRSPQRGAFAGAVLGGELYFAARDATGGGLFATDGTAVRRVVRTCTVCYLGARWISAVGPRLAFFVGDRLWWSDGTTAGTRPAESQCPPGREVGLTRAPLVFGDSLVFTSSCFGPFLTAPQSHQLHRAFPDGTLSLLRDSPRPLTAYAVDAKSVIAAYPAAEQTPTAASELWVSDGTPVGTVRVRTLALASVVDLFRFAGRLHAVGFVAAPTALPAGYGLWDLGGGGEALLSTLPVLPGSFAHVGGRLGWWESSVATAGGRVTHGVDVYDWSFVTSDGVAPPHVAQTFTTPSVGPDFAPKQRVTPRFATLGGELLFSADGGGGQQLWRMPLVAAAPDPCVDDPGVVCLRGGRFAVRARFVNQHAGGAERTAIPDALSRLVGGDTAYFWFFRPDNLELAVKVLDGGGVNGFFWVFSGGTTDLGYEVEVTDLASGTVRRYTHAPGDLCAVADTRAFSARAATAAAAPATPAAAAPDRRTAALTPPLPPECDWFGGTAACLGEGDRFQVTVEFRNQRAGGAPGVGHPFPETRDTATVRFFPNGGTELLVKVLDGRPVNGRFWVLWGGLTDLAYTLRVRDLETGLQRVYENPPGSLCGGADTRAF